MFGLDDDKEDKAKKNKLKKKHYPLSFFVQFPGIEEPIEIQVH